MLHLFGCLYYCFIWMLSSLICLDLRSFKWPVIFTVFHKNKIVAFSLLLQTHSNPKWFHNLWCITFKKCGELKNSKEQWYDVLCNILLVPPSQIQICSSASCCQTPSDCVHFSARRTKIQTKTKILMYVYRKQEHRLGAATKMFKQSNSTTVRNYVLVNMMCGWPCIVIQCG